MMPLIRKEIRLLLPFWAIAIFLAVVPSLLVSRDLWTGGVSDGVLWIFGFGGVLLGLAPFGQEFALGTFPSLLAQPSERRKFWNTKVGLTFIAGFFVLLAFALVVFLRLEERLQTYLWTVSHHQWVNDALRMNEMAKAPREYFQAKLWSGIASGAVVMLVAVIGGFWTALLFRQIGAALWFAILIPGVILVASEIGGHLLSVDTNYFLVPALLVYAIAGFICARRMFFAAQDAQWLGGTISLLNLSPTKTQTETSTDRGRRPFAALLLKEFQSHQISLLIGFGLLVLHFATLVIRKFVSMPGNSEMRFAVEAVPLLWLLIPWVIGCVAVAEERKLGTMEGQLCLPVTRRMQFITKFAVVLALGIVLGGLMPLLVEGLGVRVGVPSEVFQPQGSAHPNTYFATMAETLLGAGLIAVISFFASTLTRNTLHALGTAIAIGGLFVALFQWVMWQIGRYDFSLWRGPLIMFMGVPVWVIAVACLSFWNYKRVHAGRNVWLRNFLVLAVALFCTGLAAAIIYQRPWELAMSLEPKHGPARLTGSVRPEIVMPNNRIVALLPDGRIWVATDLHMTVVARYMGEVISQNGPVYRQQNVSLPVPRSGMFVSGSNWLALASDRRSFQVIGLQSDGSLWSVLSVTNGRNWENRWLRAVPEPKRIGSDNDWKSIATSGDGAFVAVKQDGTLWSWGQYLSTNAIPEPHRFGTNSDWATVFSGENSALFMKTNGDVWEWMLDSGGRNVRLAPRNLNGSDWVQVDARYNSDLLVVRQDGSLWTRGYGRFFGSRVSTVDYMWARVGTDNDWAQVSAGGPAPVGVKTDGRMVKSGTELFGSTLGQPSAHRGWISVDGNWQTFVALNSDGTISSWLDTRGWNPNQLLASSRRPIWSLNILSDSKN